jgi:hydrogenase nickel incorporation protein HypB
MCTTCGCSDRAAPKITAFSTSSPRQHDDHDHDHHHDHDRDHGHARRIRLEREVLARNGRLAERNRTLLEACGVVAWNLMSSPGAGKTTLLERTVRDLGAEVPMFVIAADQATARDGERVRNAGGHVVQINTGRGCHLDAAMLETALRQVELPPCALMMIENVGNLVCPALFDLGEAVRAVILSVTEGEDKPLKYPHMFRAAELMVLTKTDLLPHVPFDLERCLAYARHVNPRLTIIQLSATTGDGLDAWYEALRRSLQHAAPGSADGT